MVEINETNYCDQKPVTMQFSFEEHVVINDILNHALDAYDFLGFYEIDMLPDDSEIKRKYNILMDIKQHSHNLWMHRFDNPPYNND
jgi:hypothetical protein